MLSRNVGTRAEVITLKECRALLSVSRALPCQSYDTHKVIKMGGVSQGIVGEMNGHARASLISDAHHEIFVSERARDQRIARRAARREKAAKRA
jgi:hypothetical protein